MHDHDHEEEEGLLMVTKGTEKSTAKDPSRPTWVEELSHNHDDAEVNTFLEISSKGKLRAALSEMWDAELHLRLYDPKTSLPYQHKSLALLQEIKNHARIYVHRIGFDPPAIKENDFRLQGDLDEINNRTTDLDNAQGDPYTAIKALIETLGDHVGSNNSKEDAIIDEDLLSTLEAATQGLATLALKRPEVLPVLSTTNRIARENNSIPILQLLELRSDLLKVLPEENAAVKAPLRYAHEITRSVAKNMNL